MSADRPVKAGIWQRWVVANAWSELVGLGGSAAFAFVLLGSAGSGASAIMMSAVGVVLLGTMLEGGLVGLAQWLVLRRALDRLRASLWIGATAAGACVAWTLGMVPSTIMALQEGAGEAPPPDLGTATMIGLAFLMGLAVGPVLGFFQWLALRRHVRRAGIWIPANAVAWAFGMAIIFAGAGTLPEGATPISIAGVLALTFLVAGAAVGAVHGLVLIRLLGQPLPRDPRSSAGHERGPEPASTDPPMLIP
jgi:hypothetical protein